MTSYRESQRDYNSKSEVWGVFYSNKDLGTELFSELIPNDPGMRMVKKLQATIDLKPKSPLSSLQASQFTYLASASPQRR